MHRRTLLPLALALLPALTACFNPSIPNTGLLCGMDGECPGGQRCEAVTSSCVPEDWHSVAAIRFEPFAAPIEALADATGVQAVLLDADGQPVPVSGGQLQASLATTTTDVELIGSPLGAVHEGVVTFTGLRFSRPGRRLQLLARGGELSATSDPFEVLPTRPVVTAIAPPPSTQGCTAVSYTLAQVQGLPVDLLVEVDPDGPDGPAGYRRATQGPSAPGMAGIQGAPSSAAGRNQSFQWNSSADLPGGGASATLRFTPSIAGLTGMATTSTKIQVTNGLQVHAETSSGAVLAVADVDADGWADFVVADSLGIALEYRANKDLASTNQSHYEWISLPSRARAVAVGDFDHDGRRDLVAAVDDGSVFLIRHSRTDRYAFVAAVGVLSVAAGQIVAADFDRDGRDDFAIVEQAGGVNVRFQDPGQASGFKSVLAWPGSSDTTQVAVGDANQDGWPDLVIGRASATVVLVLGAAGRAFQPPFTDTGIRGGAVAVGDLDHDGQIEVAALDAEKLHTLKLSPAQAQPHVVEVDDLAGLGGSAMLLADVDVDGRTDVVTADSDGVQVHLHDPDRRQLKFSPSLRIGSTSSNLLALADLDRDGRPEIVSSQSASTTVYGNRTPRRCEAGLETLRGTPLGTDLSIPALDVNADGKLDLVSLRSGDKTVAVAHGLGNGGFAAEVVLDDESGVPLHLVDLAFADLDDNGARDRIEIAAAATEITLRLQSREQPGTFNVTRIAAAEAPRSVLASDVNLDGTLDLVTMAANQVLLRPGEPGHKGSFRAAVALPGTIEANACTYSQPCHLRSEDLDRDGRPDIIAEAEGRLWIYPADPDAPAGAFLPPIVADSQQLRVLAVGDLFGDPAPEVLIHSLDGNPRLDALQLGRDGKVTSAWSLSISTNQDFNGTLADFDQDGENEILLGFARSNTRIFSARKIASGAELPQVPSLMMSGPVQVADFDSDGRQDLMACHDGCLVASSAVVVAGLTGEGALPGQYQDARLGDVDGDGLLDLAWASGLQGPVHLALQSRAAPGHFDSASADLGGSKFSQFADLDGDAFADVVARSPDGETIFLNDGAGGFAAASCPVDDAASILAVADLDRDGRRDVVRWDTESVRLTPSRLGQCSASRTIFSFEQPNYVEARAVALVDMNADGWLDIVTVVPGVWVALQSSSAPGTFAPAVHYDLEVSGGAVGDIDRDGWPDVVVLTLEEAVVLRGSPTVPGSLLAPLPLIGVANLERVALGDVDGNGWTDLVVAGPYAGTLVYLQDGSQQASFAYAYHTLDTINGDFQVGGLSALLDLDGDARLDYVVLNPQRGSVCVRGR